MQKVQYDVILCTYNGSLYIKEQIESILLQPILPQCLIVSDDNSQDSTLEIVKEVCSTYNFNNYIIINGPQKGVKYNFLSALIYSKSNYIFFSDQDDIWLPNKTNIFNHFLKKTSIPQLIFSDSFVITEDGKIISESFFKYQGLTAKVFNDDSILFKNCVQGANCCINNAMKKLILESLKIVNIEYIYMHDWWIALLAKYFGEKTFIATPLIKYRQHTNNQIGAFNSRKRWIIYLSNIKLFLNNFKRAICQRKEIEKLSSALHSNLPARKDRNYHFISKIKLIIIKLLNI